MFDATTRTLDYALSIAPTPAGWRLELDGEWIGNLLHTVDGRALGYLLAVPQAIDRKTLSFETNGQAIAYLVGVALDEEYVIGRLA